MSGRIGIRVADGSFYPILESDQQGRRKLVVTTAQDNQTRVRIDFVRDDGAAVEGTALGTLEFDSVQAAPKSDAEIEVLVGVDAGNLNAWARDIFTGEKHELSVSLAADGDTFDLPDLDFSEDVGTQIKQDPEGAPEQFGLEDTLADSSLDDKLDGDGLAADQDDLTGAAYPTGTRDARRTHLERTRRSPLLLAALVVGGLVILALLAFLVFRALSGPGLSELSDDFAGLSARITSIFSGASAPDDDPAAPAAGAQAPVPANGGQPAATGGTAGSDGGDTPTGAGDAQATGAAAASGQTPADSDAASTTAPAAGGATAAAGQSPPPAGSTGAGGAAGVYYTIKWGDTLWDLSATFYRNPWLYPRLARANEIADPDVIYAGNRLFIPEL